MEEGEAATVVVSDNFHDPEGQALTYASAVAPDGVVTAELADNEDGDTVLTITPVAAGEATITVTATDPDDLSASAKIKVTVDPEGMARPTYVEGSLPGSIDLLVGQAHIIAGATIESAFSESEGEDLTFAVAVDLDTIARVNQEDDDTVTIIALALGSAIVTITAEDEDSLSVSHSIAVNVVASFQPVAVGTIPAQSLSVGGASVDVDVVTYFSDPADDDLTYTAMSSNVAAATADVVGSVVTIMPGAAGSATVTVTATNSRGMSVSQTIDVTVAGTEPTAVGEIPAVELERGGSTTVDLSEYFAPGEAGDDLNYTASVDQPSIVSATVQGDDSLLIVARMDGSAIITVTATDDDDESASQMIMVTVEPAEMPAQVPGILSTFASVAFAHGDMARTFTLSEYFSGATSYTVDSSMPSVADATEAEGVLTITPGAAGSTVVTVTARNDVGEVAQKIGVNVAAQPVPTSIKPLQAMITESDAVATTIELDNYFSGATDYIVSSNNNDAIAVSLNGHTLTLTPGTHGMATVTVTPMNDGGSGTAQTFDVRVRARPMLKDMMNFMDGKVLAITQTAADAVTGESDADPLIAAVIRYELAMYITDPDGADVELEFSTTTDDEETVAVYTTPSGGADADANLVTEGDMTDAALNDAMESTDANVTLRGRKAGSAMITVTATDEDGLDEDWTFMVTVATANAGPTVVATAFPGTSIAEADNADYFKFVRIGNQERFKSTDTAPRRLKIKLGADAGATNGIFNDVNVHQRASGDSWEFDVHSTDDEVVTATLEPTGVIDEYNVVITPQGSGIARIYFTVEDSFGETAGGTDSTETVGDITAAATDGLVDNTSFLVRVNHKPVPYSGDGDDRNSLSTETQWRNLVAAGDTAFATGVDLVDDTTTADDAEGYFSDEDNEALLCRLIETTGDSVGITIATRNEFTLTNPTDDTLTGESTFRIRCFDQVDANADGTATDFEWAEDTLRVNVEFLQSISD